MKRTTLQNFKTTNKLVQYVIDYLLDYSVDDEDLTTHVEDILKWGCVSGLVSPLIYYSDTAKFFETYKEEINDLIKERIFYDCGIYDLSKVLKGWDEEDPLVLYDNNKNVLAWWAFEETICFLESELED